MTTIRQMCETYNVTPRTLRFYEQRGLLSPIRHGNRREFTEACKKRVELILRLKGFGFSLDDVERVLTHQSNGGSVNGISDFISGASSSLMLHMGLERTRITKAMENLQAALDPAQGMKAFELEGV